MCEIYAIVHKTIKLNLCAKSMQSCTSQFVGHRTHLRNGEHLCWTFTIVFRSMVVQFNLDVCMFCDLQRWGTWNRLCASVPLGHSGHPASPSYITRRSGFRSDYALCVASERTLRLLVHLWLERPRGRLYDQLPIDANVWGALRLGNPGADVSCNSSH